MNQGDIAPLIIGHISGNVDVDLVVVVDLDGNGDVELVPTVDQALPSTVGTRFRLPLPSTYTSKSRSTSTAMSNFASRLARCDQCSAGPAMVRLRCYCPAVKGTVPAVKLK